MKKLATLLLTLMPLYAAAQDLAVTLPIPSGTNKGILSVAADGAKGKPLLLQPVFFLKTLIDSSAVSSIDRNWIEQPKKSCAIELRNEFSECTLKMTTDYPMIRSGSTASLDVKTSNGFNASTGLWLGYRGYGLGLSKNLTGEGSTFSFGAMGGRFGLNLRINTYRSDSPEARISYQGASQSYDETSKEKLDDPISVRAFFLDGYYMFNGKHFSYSAAYDQALIQKRSAGSLMAGAMYYHSRVSFDDPSNWVMTAFMRGVGKIKFSQACVGLGYAYNWVPAKGWLVSAQAMPMLQFYNRMKTYKYDIYYDSPYLIEPINLVSLFDNNMEELLTFDDEADIDDDYNFENDKIIINERDEEVTNNKIGFNFDARLAVVYNWKDFYLRVYGHYNRFRYSNDVGNGRMAEWRVYASLGFRFW